MLVWGNISIMASAKNKNRFYDLNKRLTKPLAAAVFILLIASFQQAAFASPFGEGNYDADVPYGAETSLTIGIGGNVSLNLTPSGNDFKASGSNTVTVTSTDVNGYDLFIFSSGSNSLVNGTYSIPASSNTTEAALVADTWGYNTDGSSNYIGITSYPVLLVATTGPYENGNTTTVTFGVLTDILAADGNYTGSVTFSAVPL
jgi:hypothetical protein